jgi:DNA repair ATPase RecN
MAKKKLGRQLLDTLKDVGDLIADTNDPTRLDHLIKHRRQLLQKISVLVDANIREATKEYKEATKSLDNASKSIKRALKGMESVANAIKTIAKAVDTLSPLINA